LNRIGYIKKDDVVTIAACLHKDFNLVIQTLQEIKERIFSIKHLRLIQPIKVLISTKCKTQKFKIPLQTSNLRISFNRNRILRNQVFHKDQEFKKELKKI
jgi:hypothetical protein